MDELPSPSLVLVVLWVDVDVVDESLTETGAMLFDDAGACTGPSIPSQKKNRTPGPGHWPPAKAPALIFFKIQAQVAALLKKKILLVSVLHE